MTNSVDCYWSTSAEEQLRRLESSADGLTADEAARRLTFYGPNRLLPRRNDDWLTLLLAQFKSPITLILIGAASLSFLLRDPTDAVIILVIVFISGLLGFWQEDSAANALQKLLAIVTTKASVLRDGRVSPTIHRNKPFGESVEGLSYCGHNTCSVETAVTKRRAGQTDPMTAKISGGSVY